MGTRGVGGGRGLGAGMRDLSMRNGVRVGAQPGGGVESDGGAGGGADGGGAGGVQEGRRKVVEVGERVISVLNDEERNRNYLKVVY